MTRLPYHDRRLTAALLCAYAAALLVFRPSGPAAPKEPPAKESSSFEPLSDQFTAASVHEPPPSLLPSAVVPAVPEAPAQPVVLPRHLPHVPPVRPPVKGVVLAADKADHFHDEFVELTLRAETPALLDLLKSTGPYNAWVERDGRRVITIGELAQVRLRYDQDEGLFRARWPVPWNAPDGEYRLRLSSGPWPAGLPPVETGTFRVNSRPFTPIPPGFAVLTLEGYRALDKIPGPDGVADAGGFPSWAEFVGADALFVQGGESSGFDHKPADAFPWSTVSFKGLKAFGEECHRRGLKVGVYVLSYMVGGPPEFAPNYTFGWNYDDKGLRSGLQLQKRRGVSITDPKRPGDIVAMHRKFQAMPEVDWLGLDYIRPAFGSCELVDDFVAEMPGVQTPPGFESMTPEQRMVWACRGRYSAPTPELKSQPKFILSDQWFWYRAHRTAEVVRTITQALGGLKPVWAFTLSWNKGWEHGQDPPMMRDAGLDMDGIMLYEADEKMFAGLVGQWGAYARRDQLDLIVGDTIDWPLHQKTLNPSGPESLIDRTLRAVRGFHTDRKPVRGVFFHDIGRALRGRKGPYKTMEWMLAVGHAITEVRRLNGALSYDVAVQASTAAAPGEVFSATASFHGAPPAEPVALRLFAAPDVEVSTSEVTLSADHPSAVFKVRWAPGAESAERGNRSFVAFRAAREGVREHPVIQMAYFQGKVPAPRPAGPEDAPAPPEAAPLSAPSETGTVKQ
jgi:hypothetical protein